MSTQITLDDIREGDRIRATREDVDHTVTYDFVAGKALGSGLHSTKGSLAFGWDYNYTYELLDRPLKPLKTGTLTRSSAGRVYEQTEKGWRPLERGTRFEGGGSVLTLAADVRDGGDEIIWEPGDDGDQ